MSKSHKTPTVQNITKDNTNFPVPEQLITNETETITRKKIQGKNREQPFYSDLIYRPPPMPSKNLRPNHPENESDTKPKIGIEFEENHINRVLFWKFTKDLINPIFKNQKIWKV